MKYALFEYSTENIGDEIQSLAAKKFLPRVDYYINRDYINDFSPENDEQIKIIMNGWYTHRPFNFPVKLKQINPLLISMYINPPVKEVFSSKENVEFFKKYEPIGARSIDTFEFFKNLNIESYVSGCLTLTLNKDNRISKRDFILAVDVSDEVYNKMKETAKLPIIRMGVDVNHLYMATSIRMKLAKYYLYLYQSAKLVVTTRLHATLPCLALETPVLNIKLPGFEEYRFRGLQDLANNMTEEEFINGNFDLNNPLENPDDYKSIRAELEKICSEFTNYQSNNSFLDDTTVDELLNDPELIQSFTTGLSSSNREFGVAL